MPPVLALPAIQAAIVARLQADTALTALLASGALSVYNTLPPGAAFPNLTVGKGTEVSDHAMGPDSGQKWGANCTIEIGARSMDAGPYGSDGTVLALISRVRWLFDAQPLTVVGYASVIAEVDSVQAVFPEVVDNREVRTLPLILRVVVSEGSR